MAVAWLCGCGPVAQALVPDVVAGLNALGVAAASAPDGEDAGNGIVVVDDAGEETCQRVGQLTRGGRHRVLALAGAAVGGQAAWALLAAGAEDILVWDGTPSVVEDMAARLTRWAEIDGLVAGFAVGDGIVGRSTLWQAAARQLVEAARYTDDGILVLGETGTGKEIAARLVHALDARRAAGPFIVVDCAAIVPTLSGSEFFGHERGAFTGAVGAREGAFELANGGVLFLDEVGELPADLQAQLLRVIQEKRFKRVGGNSWRTTDFRLVAATNRDLWQEVAAGRYRRDLFYRMAGWTVTLPPLRDRLEDVIPLAEHFLMQGDGDAGRPLLEPGVCDYLLRRPYPGNIRDLRQLCQRMRGRHVGSPRYTVGDIPPEERAPRAAADGDWRRGGFEAALRRAVASGVGLKEISAAAAEVAIDIATEGHTANVIEAATLLKVTPRALQLRRQKRAP